MLESDRTFVGDCPHCQTRVSLVKKEVSHWPQRLLVGLDRLSYCGDVAVLDNREVLIPFEPFTWQRQTLEVGALVCMHNKTIVVY